jgi:3',5'-cyclic AMP phosphodiesterase CpdA
MRIVHMSDLHVGRLPRSPAALFDKRLLGAANHLLRRARHFRLEYLRRACDEIERLKPELIICTGDITCIGSPEEYAAAGALLHPLCTDPARRFLFMPGNHDAYVRAAPCRAALESAFLSLNNRRWQLAELPLEWQVSGLRLLLLNGSLPVSCLLSSGALSAATLDWLERRLALPRAEGECRVAVCHFPLRDASGKALGRRRRLDGAEVVWQHLQEGRLDLVLSGHIHAPFARWDGAGRGEVCAGSLTLSGGFSVLDWTPGTRRFRQFFVDVTASRDPEVPAIEPRLAPVS